MAERNQTNPRTANERLFDASLRHQIGVRRFSTGQVKDALSLLEKADAELVEKLRRNLSRLRGSNSIQTARFKAMIADLRLARQELWREFRPNLRDQLNQLIAIEADFEIRMIESALPVTVELASIQLDVVRASIMSRPFSGGTNSSRTLQQWFDSLLRADQSRLIEAIQLGVIQGESIDSVVRRVAGTRRAGFRDGMLAITRRNAETVVRTAINHISNAAREAVWEENSDIIQALKWVSTLDGRTSAICRARDGGHAPIGNSTLPTGIKRLDPPSARPPAHPSCRSIIIAILDILGISGIIGDRPFVRDIRTGRQRQRDFRAETRSQDPERWRDADRAERNRLVRNTRQRWAEENIGRIPADTTYQDWLALQPNSFQDSVLGKTKARLFRSGKLKLDQFVDRAGNELTLDQLRTLHDDIFNQVGI